MTVLTRDLLETIHLPSSSYLTRWQRSGFIEPEQRRPGRIGGSVWPDWALRMAALIQREGVTTTAGGGGRPEPRVEMFRKIAAVLSVFPEVPFVVIIDGDEGWPAWDGAEVKTLLRRATCAAIIGIPALEEIRR